MKPKLLLAVALLLSAFTARAQLFDNLRALGGTRYPTGDPNLVITNLAGERIQGPKDIAVTDFDADNKPDFAVPNKDGTVTVRFGAGDGTFGGPLHLYTVTNAPGDLRNYSYTNYYTNVSCINVASNILVTNYPPPLPTGPPPPPIIRTSVVWVCSEVYVTNVTTNVWFL
ncbi:MAG: hypothetical protein L0219_11630, partial [Phycisphaerales bacterium]|nr:hypothetical protein [Phycisphaerales bacterium]